jgi:hypothetical protein
MRYLQRPLFWVSLAILGTVGAAVVYISVQQALRHEANDPQSAMAQDVARDLENNKKPSDLVNGYIDMATNMAPFIIIYDKYGKVVAGNGYLNNSIPQVPIGVLAATEGHKINAVTWQPDNKVRIASVSVQGGNNYYVLGGRSLFDVEAVIHSFTQWLVSLWILSLVLIYTLYKLINHKKAQNAQEPERN